MIDTCKFYVVLTNRVRRALCEAQGANKPTVKIYGNNHFFVKHPHGLPRIKVYFNLERGFFLLESSLPKILQGHNVFGSNRLEMLCLSVIKIVYAQLGVKFIQDEEDKICEAGIRLGRLDITCSFRLESPEMVNLVMEHLYEQLRIESKAWSAYGHESVESIYNRITSTRVSEKFYNKGAELQPAGRRKGIPNSVVQRQRILEIARCLLRYEVTFRAKELVGLRLNYADCWDIDRIRTELTTRLKRFNFQQVIRQKLNVDELPDLNDTCRSFYSLWAEGAILRKHRKCRTLDRARKTLLENHQVDIYRRAKTGCPVPLKDILDPNRAYFAAPMSLVRNGAIFTGHK